MMSDAKKWLAEKKQQVGTANLGQVAAPVGTAATALGVRKSF